jgi:hypothetical protein
VPKPKKIRLFPANLICTDDLDHHEYAHDPDFDAQHVDRELDTSEDEEEGDVDAENADIEESWEPLRDPPIGGDNRVIQDTEVQDKGPHAREAIIPLARSQDPIITQFPNGRAGRPLMQTTLAYLDYQTALGPSAEENIYAPFHSCMDYEVACWAQLCGPGATAFTELLHIQGVSRYISYRETF